MSFLCKCNHVFDLKLSVKRSYSEGPDQNVSSQQRSYLIRVRDVCLGQQLEFFTALLSSADNFFKTIIFKKKVSDLIWVQTVCKVNQQMTLAGKNLNLRDQNWS